MATQDQDEKSYDPKDTTLTLVNGQDDLDPLRCKTSVEREDLTNLSVRRTICTADNNEVYEFCCQCLRPWEGRASCSDYCDSDGCANHDLELLKNCKTTDLPQVWGVDACPSIWACPTCGEIVEHDKTGCKNIICPRCQKEFCFVCLNLTSSPAVMVWLPDKHPYLCGAESRRRHGL